MKGHVGVTHYSASRDKGNWKRGEDDKETLNMATKEFCFHKLGEKATELEEDFRYLLIACNRFSCQNEQKLRSPAWR